MIIALDARPLVHPQIQGAEQRARNILASLARLPPEHEFHLLYPRSILQPPEGGKAGKDAGGFDETLLARLPKNFHRVEISSYRFPWSFHSGSRVLNALARAVRAIRADVYHAFTLDVPRITACPVVPTVHDLSFELDPVVSRTPAGKRQHRAGLHAMHYARRVIAVSAQTKYDIASVFRHPPDAIDVIYNGIDPAFTPPQATDLPTAKPVHLANGITGSYVLAVGADIARRNYARMLAAMQEVWATPEGSRAKWVLAGRADWKSSDIFAAARERGVLDRKAPAPSGCSPAGPTGSRPTFLPPPANAACWTACVSSTTPPTRNWPICTAGRASPVARPPSRASA
jgi:glycosyltransferase involved in cell wall biosynthesis